MIIVYILAMVLFIFVLMCIIGVILMELGFEIADALINYGLIILLSVLSLSGIAILIGFLIEIGKMI